MRQHLKCIAIKTPAKTNAAVLLPLLFFLGAVLFAATAAAAEVVGTVANLSGPLLAKKADGATKILAQQSAVEQGDILISEKNTYARVKFIDNSEITLRPDSQLKIENFSFDEAKQENDNAVFNLVKGGLRAVTGLLGKRSKERFGLNTPTATIGIRGTIFIVEYIEPDTAGTAGTAAFGRAALAAVGTQAMPMEILPPLQLAQASPPGTDGRPPGLYVQVLDGMINLTNSGGTQNFTAGQFGYTASFKQPPVVLPSNPGIKFTPPPAFNTSTGTQGGSSGDSQKGNVDCEVR